MRQKKGIRGIEDRVGGGKMKCEVCPVGCRLVVDREKPELVTGNRCERGREFARKSLSEERVTVTGRIRIKNGNMSHLPVVTSDKVSPSEAKRILEQLSLLEAEAPVRNGERIAENIGESGTDLIAARSIRRRASTKDSE